MPARSTKSTVFKIFLEALCQKYGKVAFGADNAKSQDLKLIKDYIKLDGGDVVLIPLPVYAPQLSTIEVQWRMIKARLAGRRIADEHDIEDYVRRLVESGQFNPSR